MLFRSSCPGNNWAFVAGATAPISRSDDESMVAHRRGGATKKAGLSRRNPPGGRGLRPVSASLVGGDATASTPPRLLDTASQAPSANAQLFRGQDTSVLKCQNLHFMEHAFQCQRPPVAGVAGGVEYGVV